MKTEAEKQAALEVSRSAIRVAAFAAVKKRRQGTVNIWFFDSPKNQKRFTIRGDLKFFGAVLMEGDPTISSYDPEPAPIQGLIDNNVVEYTPGCVAYLHNQTSRWCEFTYAGANNRKSSVDLMSKKAVASQKKMDFRIQSEKDLGAKALLFDNWVDLCSAINRCRNISCDREERLILTTVNRSPTTLGTLLHLHGVDPACMYASVGKLLQKSIITTDLHARLLGLDSIIARFSND